MIYKIYNFISNIMNESYDLITCIYELPINIKILIKEHTYYKTEFLNLISEYEKLNDKYNILLKNHIEIMNNIT